MSKVTTTTYEYDDEGRVVKETVVENELPGSVNISAGDIAKVVVPALHRAYAIGKPRV